MFYQHESELPVVRGAVSSWVLLETRPLLGTPRALLGTRQLAKLGGHYLVGQPLLSPTLCVRI